jgi:hypothetical protein
MSAGTVDILSASKSINITINEKAPYLMGLFLNPLISNN